MQSLCFSPMVQQSSNNLVTTRDCSTIVIICCTDVKLKTYFVYCIRLENSFNKLFQLGQKMLVHRTRL